MASWFIIPIGVLLAGLLGSAIVLQFSSPAVWRTLDGLFVSLITGVITGGWLGLLLAELGAFSLTSFLVTWLLASMALFGVYWRRRAGVPASIEQDIPSTSSLGHRLLPWLLIAWLLIVSWLYFRPHEYILGGADAGVYVSLGAEIAQHGGFAIYDEALSRLEPEVQSLFLRPLPSNPVAPAYLFPGFYVEDAVSGTVTPQFYPLHPVWQAIAFSLGSQIMEGVKAELLITGLWMALSSVALILTARELGDWPAALLLMAALPIAALQVWFARYPTTEAMTQMFLWTGLWAMVRWQGNAKPSALWAFASGAALGAMFLVRIDILVLLPILAVFIGWLWWRGWEKIDWWFVTPLVLLIAHSLVHGVLFSAPYFYEHIGFGLRLLWSAWWLMLLGAAAVVLLLWLLTMFRSRSGGLKQYRAPLLAVAIGAFLVYALYGWFVRPAIMEPILRPDLYSETIVTLTNHENWRRFGWYMSLAGVWLGVAGICLLIWRVDRRTGVLVATGLVFSVIYLWNVRANPHHVYVMRRYVPAVAPFFLLASAYLLSQLPQAITGSRARHFLDQRLALVVTSVAALTWLGTLGWSARGFVSQIDNQGVLQQLVSVHESLPTHSVLLFNDPEPVGIGDFWGTPLKYIFGHDAFKIRDEVLLREAPLAETIHIWQNSGRAVVWIGDTAWLREHGFEYEERRYTISSYVLESSYEHKPREIVPVEWSLPAAFLQSDPINDS